MTPIAPLEIAGKSYNSRLLVGTGKYKDLNETREAIVTSGAEIVTVAIRRVNIGQNPGEPSLLDVVPPEDFTILPNTAFCYTAEEAVRTLKLARELLDGHKLVKLEVLGDEKTLFPNIVETLKAAETLIADDFDVMVYTSDDPILAKRFEEMGCVAVMPLAGPIGSGLGICNPYNIRMILENAEGPHPGRRRRGHRQRCQPGHGTWLCRRAHEHRHRRCQRSDSDGKRDEKSRRSGT